MQIKTLLTTIVFLLFCVASVKATEVGLFVSDEDLSFQAQQQIYTYSGNPLYVGGELFYSENNDRDSWLFNGYLSVEDLYQKTVNLGLGFEAMVGNVKPNQSYDVFSVGFRLLGDINLEKTPSKLPFSVETSLFYSPPILSFADTERVFRWNLGVYFHLNTSAALGINYEIIDVDLDKPGDPSWDNSTLMLGAKIVF